MMKPETAPLTPGVVIDKLNKRVLLKANGLVLKQWDFTDWSVVAQASNVQVIGCLFNGAGFFTFDQAPGCMGALVRGCNFTLDRGTLNLKNAAYVRSNGPITVEDCMLDGLSQDGMILTAGVVQRCTIRRPGLAPNAHSDGISVSTSTGALLIKGNTIDFTGNKGNNAIRLAAVHGAIKDVTVDANTLIGGTFSVFAALDPTHDATASISGVTVNANRIYGMSGGPLYPAPFKPVWTSNVDQAGKIIPLP
jgi:hypothetical protein